MTRREAPDLASSRPNPDRSSTSVLQFVEGRVVHRLPSPPTPLIGRHRELAAARELFSSDQVRLVTFTGPAGVGKTRFALKVAAEVADLFELGAAFVDLAPVSDPGQVLSAVAEALDVHDRPGQSLLDTLAHYLSDASMLLFLDNFEHVIDAAPEIARLLVACPHLEVIVTSRSALRLRWEHVFLLAPLDFPRGGDEGNLGSARTFPAIVLFADRARAVNPSFALTDFNVVAVAGICRRLDGLPLAIELAAAQSDFRPPEDILEGLRHSRLGSHLEGNRDLPDRQRTLGAAIGWSYELLSADERKLFRRIGVFAGGCTVESASAVCGLGDAPATTVGLGSLVRRNLLYVEDAVDGERRFRALETITEYAREQLLRSGEDEEIQRRHTKFYLDLAEQADLVGPDQVTWLDRLHREHDELRAVLQRSISQADVATSLRLGVALTRFWSMRGHLREGRDWLDKALALPWTAVDLRASSTLRARALTGAAILARQQSDFDEARKLHDAALALVRPGNDRRAIADALFELGVTTFYQGDMAASGPTFEEVLSIQREIGNLPAVAIGLFRLANIEHIGGRLTKARELHRESLAILVGLNDKRGIADSLFNIGYVAADQGDNQAAVEYLGRSLTLMEELKDSRGLAWVLEGFAGLAARSQPVRAVRLASAASALRDLVGAPVPPAAQPRLAQAMDPARQALSAEDWRKAWADGQAMSFDAAVAYARRTEPTDPTEGRLADPETPEPNVTLTRREREVVELVAHGLTNREIAARLVISEMTTAVHVKHILNKLKVRSRKQAAAWVRHRLVVSPET